MTTIEEITALLQGLPESTLEQVRVFVEFLKHQQATAGATAQ